MAIDTIARGLAASLTGSDGRIATDKMPVLSGTSNLEGFTSIGKLTDPTLIEGKTSEEILLMMLYGVVSPTLIDPALTISFNDSSFPLIIGRQTLLEGTLVFNQGKIDPAYGTSGARTGAVTGYKVNNIDFTTSSTQYDFSLSVLPTDMDFEVSYAVTYEEGDQPLNSIGQPVGAPYPAGTIQQTQNLNAIYALYDATGADVDFEIFTDEDGKGYLATFASEGTGILQTFCVSNKLTVIGIKGYDQFNQKWNWLGGESAKNSLTHFDTTNVSGEQLGEDVDYTLYTHNQLPSGERQLRIYVI